MNIDQTATNFIRLAIKYNPFPFLYPSYPIEKLKDFYVPWDGETVGELADGTKISEHNKEVKIKKFNEFKDLFLNNKHKELTIFAVTKEEENPILIIDGVHRAVGLQKSINKSKRLPKENINLILVLFKSRHIQCMPDYKKLLGLISRR